MISSQTHHLAPIRNGCGYHTAAFSGPVAWRGAARCRSRPASGGHDVDNGGSSVIAHGEHKNQSQDGNGDSSENSPVRVAEETRQPLSVETDPGVTGAVTLLLLITSKCFQRLAPSC